MEFVIKPIWSTQVLRTETCIILGGGPSLRNFSLDFAITHCHRFITINDSWRLLPWHIKTTASVVNYFCDANWWSMQIQKNPRSMDNGVSFHKMIYRGYWITGSNDPGFIEHPQVRVVELTGQRGLELNPTGIRHGSNSGYQAINIAVHLGVKRIILLGYDMKVDGYRTNWHNEFRLQAPAYSDTIQRSMLPHFPTLIEPLKELGVEVINATPDSRLTCFPMMSLEQVFNQPPYPVWKGEMENYRS